MVKLGCNPSLKATAPALLVGNQRPFIYIMRRWDVILCKVAADFQGAMKDVPVEGVPGRADSQLQKNILAGTLMVCVYLRNPPQVASSAVAERSCLQGFLPL